MLSDAPILRAESRVESASHAAATVARRDRAVWAIVGIGLVLRLIALGRKSFWLDEIASLAIVLRPGAAFWSWLAHHEANMALYYILLKPWVHLWLAFGIREDLVRLLSVVSGVAAIPVFYLLGARLFGERTGLTAAAFFALNTCAVVYSQEARGYSLLLLAVVASSYLFVRLLDRPSWLYAISYGLTAGLMLHCHFFGAYIVLAQGGSLFFLPNGRRPWKHLVLAVFLCAIFAITIACFVATQDTWQIIWVSRTSLLEI
jgi:mannosyltransferase